MFSCHQRGFFLLCWGALFLLTSSEEHGEVSEFKKKLQKESAKERAGKDAAQPFKWEEGRLFNTEPISDLDFTIPPEYQNDTLVQDHHIYYNSTFYGDIAQADQYWVDMSTPNAKTHSLLSTSHRQATTVQLTFDFPFYGYPLRNVTIATGGFLYTGDYLHNWIAATQYIAPLMANFDTSQTTESSIKYLDNGTAFTVEWSNVPIQNKLEDGVFDFQVTLYKSGDIVFAYKDIPYSVPNISDSKHPVKVGISDAYILERSFLFVRRKTIYEYHRIDMMKAKISNHTAIYFTALPTCSSYRDCQSCMSAFVALECNWCGAVRRCSDGVDRSRQSWVGSGCLLEKAIPEKCTANPSDFDNNHPKSPKNELETSTKHVDRSQAFDDVSGSAYNIDNSANAASGIDSQSASSRFYQEQNASQGGISVGAIVVLAMCISALLGIIGWIGYAYKFPQSASGQFLIKYRPSQWSFKKQEETISANSRHI